jgi:hypothetical protein
MTNGACEPRRSKSSRGTNIGFRPSRCHWCRDTELCRRESSFPEFSSDNTPGSGLLNRTTIIKRILTRTLSFNAMFPSGKIQHRRVILVHIGYPQIKKRYKIRYRIPDILFPTTLVVRRPCDPGRSVGSTLLRASSRNVATNATSASDHSQPTNNERILAEGIKTAKNRSACERAAELVALVTLSFAAAFFIR